MKRIIRLTESDLVKIVKMVINEDDPKNPTATPTKTKGQVLKVNFNMIDPKIKKIEECSISGVLSQVNGKLTPPETIQLKLLRDLGRGKINVQFDLVGGSTYVLNKQQPGIDVSKFDEWLYNNTGNIAKGLYPATAIQQFINNISNQTGVNVTVRDINKIKEVYEKFYWKTGVTTYKSQQIGGGILAPFKICSLTKYFNPESNQQIGQRLMLGSSSYECIYKNNRFVANSATIDFIVKKQSEGNPNAYVNRQEVMANINNQIQSLYEQLNS